MLGFSFYDLWARLKVRGPDDAWKRLTEILAWEEEVAKAGGYRAYYAGGKHGTTLQGGGTAGGIGVDHEFFESSLLPSIVTYGFVGLRPGPEGLSVQPRLPASCPEMTIHDVLYRNVRMDVTVSEKKIVVEIKEPPVDGIRILLDGEWTLAGAGKRGTSFVLSSPGRYRLEKG